MLGKCWQPTLQDFATKEAKTVIFSDSHKNFLARMPHNEIDFIWIT